MLLASARGLFHAKKHFCRVLSKGNENSTQKFFIKRPGTDNSRLARIGMGNRKLDRIGMGNRKLDRIGMGNIKAGQDRNGQQ